MKLLILVAALFALASAENEMPAAETIDFALEMARDVIPNYDEVRARFEDHFDEFENSDLSDLFSNLAGGGVVTNKTCILCKNLLGLVQLFKDIESLEGLVKPICNSGTTLDREECNGLLKRLAPPLFYIIKHTVLSLEEACSVIFGDVCLKYLDYEPSDKLRWELKLPEKTVFKPRSTSGGAIKKVLHLTDVHLDLLYAPHGEVHCPRPLCCRAMPFDPSPNVSYQAGLYGDTRGDCDVPIYFVSEALKHIADAHQDLDYIFWTGDSVPHNVWDTSEETNLDHVLAVTHTLQSAFAHHTNLTIVPVLGNHEVHPINMYVPEVVQKTSNFSSQWLYLKLSQNDEYWSRYIDTPEAVESFNRGGYYSKQLTHNWRVLGLNTNFGYKSNFWTGLDPRDPQGQLQWLIEQLTIAEKDGVYVTLLGHVPPNGDTFEHWTRNYIRIIDRFSHLLRNAYYGHTHNEELAILYNEQDKPVQVNYISGSLTTFSHLNPSYKILSLDETGEVIDYEIYYLDMDQANVQGHLEWRQLFASVKKAYDLKDLSPQSWHEWYGRALANATLADMYYANYHRKSSQFVSHSNKTPEDIRSLVKSIRKALVNHPIN